MDLLGLIILLIVIGVVMWLVNTYIPMEPKIKQILNVAVVIIVILWLLDLFVGFGALHIPIRRV